MPDIDKFYDSSLGKDSALFIGTLWLGMIAKHMNEVRIASDGARTNLNGDGKDGSFDGLGLIQAWLDKLQSLYDNVEFKTDIPFSKKDKELEFEDLVYNPTAYNYELQTITLHKRDFYLKWFEKIQLMIDICARIGEMNNENRRVVINKRRDIVKELSKCQRAFYREIEKKHLIMPPEKEDMKDIVKSDWIDRDKSKDLYSDYMKDGS